MILFNSIWLIASGSDNDFYMFLIMQEVQNKSLFNEQALWLKSETVKSIGWNNDDTAKEVENGTYGLDGRYGTR